MLIGGEKQFFYFFTNKILSVFDANWIQKYTLNAPNKLFSTRNFTKFSWPPYQAFPDTVIKR